MLRGVGMFETRRALLRLLEDHLTETRQIRHELQELRQELRALVEAQQRQDGQLEDVRQRLEGLPDMQAELHSLSRHQVRRQRQIEKARQTPIEKQAETQRLFAILQRLYDDEPGNRRRLTELRGSPSYEPAFTGPTPLVSVIIPTYANVEALVTRSVPSVLAQTYENFELLVIGDGAPPEIGEGLRQFDDPRLVYVNRERRGPYPDDPKEFLRVKAVPPLNVGMSIAKGSWIAGFADDDVMRPQNLETLIGAAREGRHEFCYGRLLQIAEDGDTRVSGEWPPEVHRISLQAAVYHSGLTFIQHELADADFRNSAEKSLIRRMLNAGVRFGFVDDIVAEYAWKKREPKVKKQ